jgi:hypothetical protein
MSFPTISDSSLPVADKFCKRRTLLILTTSGTRLTFQLDFS